MRSNGMVNLIKSLNGSLSKERCLIMKQHFVKYPITETTDCDPIYRLHVNME